MKAIALSHGVEFISVEFDFDKRNLPAGSATAELAEGSDEAVALKALQGQDCVGRPLRVQSIILKKSRLSGGRADRYFLGDGPKDFKCNTCGLVGHKAADCESGTVSPCHLCAGRDHDAGTVRHKPCNTDSMITLK